MSYSTISEAAQRLCVGHAAVLIAARRGRVRARPVRAHELAALRAAGRVPRRGAWLRWVIDDAELDRYCRERRSVGRPRGSPDRQPRARVRGELAALRGLYEDVARWRESGDARDLLYVLETMDGLEAQEVF